MHPLPSLRLPFKIRILFAIVTVACLVAAIVKQATEIRSLKKENDSLRLSAEAERREAEYERTVHAVESLRAAGAAMATTERVVIDEQWAGDSSQFARIGDLRDLNFLGLSSSRVTDDELKVIVSLPRLKILRLDDTKLDDRCVDSIIAAKSLNFLSVCGTRLTEDGIRRIRAALPSLHMQTRRVLVSISPPTASAGLACQAVYTVTLTNDGSDPDSFEVSASCNWLVEHAAHRFEPATSRSSWGAPTAEVAYPREPLLIGPGVSNAQSITLKVTPRPTVEPKAYSLSVWVQSITDKDVRSDQASATLDVLPLGVIVTLSPLPAPGITFRPDVVPTAPPGTTFEATITNVGKSTDTFDLSLAGLGAALATLESTSLTIPAGDSQSVKITTRAVKFADGNLPLAVVAVSQTNAAVQAQTGWTLVMGAGGRELVKGE